MAHDLEIRFRCRTHFEIYDRTLKEISELESVPITTLSDWKNDDRDEYGGIWLKGSRKSEIGRVAKMLHDELITTNTYDHLKKSLDKRAGITTDKKLDYKNALLQIEATPQEIQAQVEADALMLSAVGIDWYDSALLKNAILSQTVLNNQVKSDITKVRQSDIKTSSETIKMAKEAKYGKDPETVIFNNNGNYSPEELADMSIEQLEKLAREEEMKVLEGKIAERLTQ